MLNVVAVVYSFYLSRKMFASISEILKLWPAERIIKISSVKRSYFWREEKNETILGYLILDPTRVLGSTYYLFTRMINSPGDKISLSLHFYLIIKEDCCSDSPLLLLYWRRDWGLYWTVLCFINTVIWLRIRLLGAKLPSFRTIQVCRITLSMPVLLSSCSVPPSWYQDVTLST